MSTSSQIQNQIASMAHGAVISGSALLALGSRASVDQTLYRMVKQGQIVRVARGLYAVAASVGMDAVAHAVAYKTGERVGPALRATTAPSQPVIVPTSGQTRTVTAAGQRVQFRRMSQRKIDLSHTAKGQVLLGLWMRGEKRLTSQDIQHATGDWSVDDLRAYAPLIPEWLRCAIELSNAPRKSTQIGLSGAYDWSNPHIKDAPLIGKVLEKHKFEDVVRVCAYFGLAKVRRVFRQSEFGPMTRSSVSRMLKNIAKGLAKNQGVAHAQT